MFITCPKCSARYQVPNEIDLPKGKKLQCSACQFVFKYQPVVQEKQVDDAPVLVPPKDAVLTTVSLNETEIGFDKKETQSNESVLPEVFCPVVKSSPKVKFPYWKMVICLFFVVVLSMFGWHYRHLLFMDISLPKIERRHSRPLKKTVSTSKVVEKHNAYTVPVSEKIVEVPAKTLNELDLKDIPIFPEENVSSKKSLVVQNSRFRLTQQTNETSVLIEGVLYNNSDQTQPLPEKLFAIAYGVQGTTLFKKEIYLPRGVLEAHKEQAFFGTYTPAPKEIQWIDISLDR